jgi:hypothetical protein
VSSRPHNFVFTESDVLLTCSKNVSFKVSFVFMSGKRPVNEAVQVRTISCGIGIELAKAIIFEQSRFDRIENRKQVSSNFPEPKKNSFVFGRRGGLLVKELRWQSRRA